MRRSVLSASVVLTVQGALVITAGGLFLASRALGDMEEAWTATYDGPSRSLDVPVAIAASDLGGWVVTGGSCRSAGSACNAVTMRYDSEGRQVWVSRIGDPTKGWIQPGFLALDSAGDAYVCGADASPSAGLFLVKYDGRTGNELWVRFDRGEAGGSRAPAGMALDGAGDIVVVGTAWEPGDGGSRIAVYKYAGNGELRWQTFLGSPAGGGYDAIDMALGPSGRVVILARGPVSGESSDSSYAVFSCDSSGTEEAAFALPESISTASQVALDRAGDIHVAANQYLDESSFLLLTYDPQGQPLGLIEPGIAANSAHTLLVDEKGLVYAVGSKSYGPQLFAVCLDPGKSVLEGGVVWNVGDGIVTEWDARVAAALDAAGSLHVACASEGRFIAMKLDAAGQVLWTARSEGLSPMETGGPAIAVDREGRAGVTAPTESALANSDFTTMAVSAEGTALWEVRYDDVGSAEDAASFLLVDAGGNAITVGASTSAERASDIVVLKHAPDGSLAWVTRHGSDDIASELPTAAALDAAGNVYVAATFESERRTFDYFLTLKFASDGNLLWTARHAGAGEGPDLAAAIAVDATGCAHVTGTSGTEIETVKYDPEGRELWSARSDGAIGEASAIALGPGGEVAVGGQAWYPDSRSVELVTVLYGPGGTELWAARKVLEDGVNAHTNVVAVLRGGEVRAAAQYLLSGQNRGRLVIVSYDSGGRKMWESTHGDDETGWFAGGSMQFDAEGALHLAGAVSGSGGNRDIAIWKFGQGGRLDWVATYDGLAGGYDTAGALALDAQGNVYLAGQEDTGGWPPGVCTMKFSPEGRRLWVKRLAGPPGAFVSSSAVAADGRGDVWVAGYLTPDLQSTDILVVKYAPVARPFRRGDFNGDGDVGGSVTDAVLLLSHQFLGGPEPPCLAACDANADGLVDLSDPIYLLQFSFLGGAPPPPPYPDCGTDADTEIECATPGC